MRKKGYEVVIIDGLEYKECSECHEIKPLNYIYDRGVKKGYREKCYDCRKEEAKLRYSSLSDEKKLEKIQRDKKRYDEKRPEILEQKKKYGSKNKEKISKSQKQYRENNKEKITEDRKKNYIKNSKRDKEKAKRYREKNKDKLKIREKEKRKKNKEKLAESNKIWRDENKDYIRDYHREYYHKKKSDASFLIKRRLRARLKQAFSYFSKNGKVMSSKKYGIDFGEIFRYIGDCPGDVSLYSLDHTIPLSKFDFDNPEHVKLSHIPENIQWMLMSENLDKRDKFTKQIFLSPVLINILKIIGRYEEACLECFGTTNHEIEIEKESQNAT